MGNMGGAGMERMLAADGAWAALDDAAVINNTWGRGALVNGTDYAQTVRHGDSLADRVRFDWSWPEADPRRVMAFPAVFAGQRPFNRAQEGGAGMPVRLEAVESLTLDYALDWGGDEGGFNVALDIWISSDPLSGAGAITHEVMIWLKPAAFSPAGGAAGSSELDGASYLLSIRPEDADDPHDWTYAAFLTQEPVKAGRVDIGAALDHLIAGGVLDGDLWLMDVELGAEITGGQGWLEISEFDLTLEAAPAPEPIRGGAGADLLEGGAHGDVMAGRGGDDRLIGGDGADLLRGGAGDDRLEGGRGADRLEGGAGRDRLSGDGGDDHLAGGADDDALLGGPGRDRIHGGAGDDVLRGGAGKDSLQGADGADALMGQAGADALLGGAGDDLLSGGAGADALDGGDGNDRLSGGAGADRLRGGAGDDLLSGGAGADAFIFAPGDGTDRILDFDPSEDRLILRAFGLTETPTVQDGPEGATLTIGDWTAIFEHVDVDALHAGHFML